MLILLTGPQHLDLMEWFKIQKMSYLKNALRLFHEIKEILICPSKTTFLRNNHFSADITFDKIESYR